MKPASQASFRSRADAGHTGRWRRSGPGGSAGLQTRLGLPSGPGQVRLLLSSACGGCRRGTPVLFPQHHTPNGREPSRFRVALTAKVFRAKGQIGPFPYTAAARANEGEVYMTLRGALLAATMLALPVAASAQPVTGLYIGLGAGVNLMQDENVNSSVPGAVDQRRAWSSILARRSWAASAGASATGFAPKSRATSVTTPSTGRRVPALA